jgi:hypothetical protein
MISTDLATRCDIVRLPNVEGKAEDGKATKDESGQTCTVAAAAGRKECEAYVQRTWRTFRAMLAVLVAVLLGLVVNLATGSVALPFSSRWILLALLVLVMAAVGIEVIRARQDSLGWHPDRDLPVIANQLAAMVLRQYQEVQQRERLRASLLNVRWRRVPTAAPGPAEPSRPAEHSLAGELSGFERFYRAIPSGRLVVLGGAWHRKERAGPLVRTRPARIAYRR